VTKVWSWLLLALCVLTSCAAEKRANYDEINAIGMREPLYVVFQNGKRIDTDSLHISNDSTRWCQRSDGSFGSFDHYPPLTVPTSDLRKIVYTSRILGSPTGQVLGLVGGELLGAAIGVWIAPPAKGYFDLIPFLYVIGSMALGGVAGGILGSFFLRTDYIIH